MQIEKGQWSLIQLNNLVDVRGIIEEPPKDRGKFGYDKKGRLNSWIEEGQVAGSLARYNHPKFIELHTCVMEMVEQVIHEKLYPTYYFDRFYFRGQELKRHSDRGSCEISVSMHISTNAKYPWPIYFEVDNTVKELTCKPGDAILYKGCELDHWREPLKGPSDTYFHQIFFHYVRANGYYLQHAYDTCVEDTAK